MELASVVSDRCLEVTHRIAFRITPVQIHPVRMILW